MTIKYINRIFLLVLGCTILTACSKDDYPVPTASTVSNFTYTINNDRYAPATVTFSNQSIVPDNAGDAYFTWIFGDGSKSTDVNPIHTYTGAGTYTAQLIVKTTESLELKKFSQTIAVLSADAAGIPVYFTDGSKVYSGLLNNDAPVFSALSIGSLSDCYGLALDTINSQLYIADSGNGIIYKYNISSKEVTTFRSGLTAPDAMAIDYKAGKLYWDTSSGIQCTSLSSSSVTDVEDFVTGQTNDPEGMAIDTANNKLYWINYNGGLWSINLDGTSKTELLSEPQGGSIIVVGNRLYFDYYNASGDIQLKSTDLDGSNMSTLTTGISKVVFGLGYDAVNNKIYWGDRNKGKIMRSDLDGSNIETWYSATSPRGIVFGKQ